MTNEEAIKVLRSLYNVQRLDTLTQEEMTAVAMAIKALETVSCIKEKCAYCPHCENCDVDDETLEIKALEQQPCEDCISRQAVKEAICDYVCGKDIRCVANHECNMKKLISELPPVTPKEKTGMWINDWEMGMSECSCCGETYLWEDHKGTENFHYCPNCGARMVSE